MQVGFQHAYDSFSLYFVTGFQFHVMAGPLETDTNVKGLPSLLLNMRNK